MLKLTGFPIFKHSEISNKNAFSHSSWNLGPPCNALFHNHVTQSSSSCPVEMDQKRSSPLQPPLLGSHPLLYSPGWLGWYLQPFVIGIPKQGVGLGKVPLSGAGRTWQGILVSALGLPWGRGWTKGPQSEGKREREKEGGRELEYTKMKCHHLHTPPPPSPALIRARCLLVSLVSWNSLISSPQSFFPLLFYSTWNNANHTERILET